MLGKCVYVCLDQKVGTRDLRQVHKVHLLAVGCSYSLLLLDAKQQVPMGCKAAHSSDAGLLLSPLSQQAVPIRSSSATLHLHTYLQAGR